MPRYAIYAAPERDTRLWHFGCRVLGRDAETGEDVAQIVPKGFAAEEWRELTASPRRYGFHATLKAPFVLAAEQSEEDLLDAVRTFARRQEPVENVPLKPELSGGFVFLTPERPDERLNTFAEASVQYFEPFRAPLTDEDRARRKNLTERQAGYLDRFGYPYVFEDFQFHLTLAGPLPEVRAADVHAALAAAAEQALKGESLSLRSVCLFYEPGQGEPARLVLRAPLGTR